MPLWLIVGIVAISVGVLCFLLWGPWRVRRASRPAPAQPPTPDQIANQQAAEHYAQQHPTVHSVRFVRPNRRRPLPIDEEPKDDSIPW